MSELQLGLLAIGALIVAGVYGFNKLQERRYRRHAERAFQAGHDDILLTEGALREDPREAGATRIEPRWSGTEAGEHQFAEENAPGAETSRDDAVEHRLEAGELPSLVDDRIDYLVTLYAEQPIDADALAKVGEEFREFGRRVRWLGQNRLTGGWEEIPATQNVECLRVVAALQLANRAGPVVAGELEMFCDRVQAVADRLSAIADFPDRGAALERAADLDRFCAEVDVMVGVNVAGPGGQAFPATKVRAFAEAEGMKLWDDGAFHYCDETGRSQFFLCNLETTAFSPENIRNLSTRGVTLLLEVPRVANGAAVFGQMLALANRFAASVRGTVVDDNGKPLTDAGIARIKEQLGGLYDKMGARRIEAGSFHALRLFS
jgi:hypothetical protein